MHPEPLTDIERKIMQKFHHLPDNATGYNRITIDFYDLDMQDIALSNLLARGYVNGVPLPQPFGPRLVAFGLSSLTPRGRRALDQD